MLFIMVGFKQNTTALNFFFLSWDFFYLHWWLWQTWNSVHLRQLKMAIRVSDNIFGLLNRQRLFWHEAEVDWERVCIGVSGVLNLVPLHMKGKTQLIRFLVDWSINVWACLCMCVCVLCVYVYLSMCVGVYDRERLTPLNRFLCVCQKSFSVSSLRGRWLAAETGNGPAATPDSVLDQRPGAEEAEAWRTMPCWPRKEDEAAWASGRARTCLQLPVTLWSIAVLC